MSDFLLSFDLQRNNHICIWSGCFLNAFLPFFLSVCFSGMIWIIREWHLMILYVLFSAQHLWCLGDHSLLQWVCVQRRCCSISHFYFWVWVTFVYILIQMICKMTYNASVFTQYVSHYCLFQAVNRASQAAARAFHLCRRKKTVLLTAF